jgi:hypothetical protein
MDVDMLSEMTSPLIPARQLLVIRKIRERGDFQGRFVVPSCEITSIGTLFINCSLNLFPLLM